MRPGSAVGQVLQQWAEEPRLTPAQFDERCAELWKTTAQFERELREEAISSEYFIR